MSITVSRARNACVAVLAILSATASPTSFAQAPQSLFTDAYAVAKDMPNFVDPTIIHAVRPDCTNAPGDEKSPALISRAGNAPFNQFTMHRKIFSFNPPRPVATCNPYRRLSDIVVDANFLYYIENQGPGGSSVLWRRSRNENVPDASERLVDFGSAITNGELLLFSTVIFVILHRPGQNDVMLEYLKAPAAVNFLGTVESAAADTMRNMQTDRSFLYWINGLNLRLDDLTNGAKITAVTGGHLVPLPRGL